MARGKKTVGVIDNTGAVEAFIGRCFFESGERACITPSFGAENIFNGVTYMFTEEVLDGMIESGRVKVTYRGDKTVSIIGVE